MVCVEFFQTPCVCIATLGYKIRVKGINGNSRVFKCLVKDHLLKFWA